MNGWLKPDDGADQVERIPVHSYEDRMKGACMSARYKRLIFRKMTLLTYYRSV